MWVNISIMNVDCDLFFCTHGRDCVLWPKPWRCKVVTRSGHCVPSKAWPSYSPHPHASCINDYIRIILQVTLIEVYGFPNFINPTRDGGGCSAYQPPRETYLLCGGQAQAATGSSGPASGEQFKVHFLLCFFSWLLPWLCTQGWQRVIVQCVHGRVGQQDNNITNHSFPDVYRSWPLF